MSVDYQWFSFDLLPLNLQSKMSFSQNFAYSQFLVIYTDSTNNIVNMIRSAQRW